MRSFKLMLVLLVVLPSAAASQSLRPGSRVRVTANGHIYTGRLNGIQHDTIAVDSLRLALNDVTRLRVYQRGSKAGEGALIGAGVLGAIGLIAVLAIETNQCDGGSYFPGECDLDFAGDVALVAVPAAVGAFIGLSIGALIRTGGHWETVPTERWRVSFSPQRDGRFALGLSVAF